MKILKVLIVMVALQLIADLGISAPRATGTVIGTVISGGAFRLNGDTVISNGTLLEGAVIETARTDSSVRLSGGTRLSLSPDSRAKLYGDRMILEKGEIRLENGIGFHLEALGLVVRPEVRPGGGLSSGRIGLEGGAHLRVAALTGSFRVWNARGMLVANVPAGSALAFEPQVSAAAVTTQITGTLTEQHGHFMLTDRVTRVTMEIKGQRLAAYIGQVVGVTGALNVAATSIADAPQVLAASQVQPIAAATPAAVVGGVSAVQSRAQPEDVPPGPPPGRPKGPPPGRPKGPPETPPGLSR